MASGQKDETPSVQPTAPESCALCGVTEKLKRCAKCMSVAYCCKEHQKQDWKIHKQDCKLKKEESVNKENRESAEKQSNESNKAKTHEINKAVEVNHPEQKQSNGESKSEAAIDLSFEFDKRPYKPGSFAQPSTKEPDALALHVTSMLKKQNHCVVNDLFNLKLAKAIFTEVTTLHSSGIFMDGQLSGGRTSSEKSQIVTKKAIRGDKITWMEGNEKGYPYICLLVKTLDGLLSRMNYYLKGECDVGGRTKAMVACYPGDGTGYACHVDNPNRDGRCITCLYYLNEGWDAKEYGGLLRLFQGSDGYVDVEPMLNRALFFWSDRRNPHEVQPAFKTRYAITVWYLDKHERQEAKEALKSQSSEDIKKLQKQYTMMDLGGEQDKVGVGHPS